MGGEEMIPFEELPMEVMGMPVAPFCGAAWVDLPSGVISRVELGHWLGNSLKTVTISDTQGGGLGRVIFSHLRPLLRQRFADQIAEMIREYHADAPARSADAWLERMQEFA